MCFRESGYQILGLVPLDSHRNSLLCRGILCVRNSDMDPDRTKLDFGTPLPKKNESREYYKNPYLLSLGVGPWGRKGPKVGPPPSAPWAHGGLWGPRGAHGPPRGPVFYIFYIVFIYFLFYYILYMGVSRLFPYPNTVT